MLLTNLSALVITLTACMVMASDTKTRTTFHKLPGTMSLSGLKCARERFRTSRGVRYNLETRECETLDRSWYSHQVTELGYNYYILSLVENLFTPTDIVEEYIPDVVLVGLTVVVKVEILSNPASREIVVNFYADNSSVIPFHMTTGHDSTVFNDHSPAKGWGDEIIKPYLFNDQSTPAVYTFEFKFSETEIQTHVNGELFNRYKHRAPLTAYKRVVFKIINNRGFFQQVQYVYPQ